MNILGETPPESGAIYIANVLVTLPPLAEIQEASERLQRYDAYWSAQEFGSDESTPSVPATVISLDGSVADSEINAAVTYYEPGSPYVLLQGFVGDGENEFDGLFSRTAEDGNFGFHVATDHEVGVYIVPVEACGSAPVLAVAALCLGSEAIEYGERPDQSKIDALFVAAKIALGQVEL